MGALPLFVTLGMASIRINVREIPAFALNRDEVTADDRRNSHRWPCDSGFRLRR